MILAVAAIAGMMTAVLGYLKDIHNDLNELKKILKSSEK